MSPLTYNENWEKHIQLRTNTLATQTTNCIEKWNDTCFILTEICLFLWHFSSRTERNVDMYTIVLDHSFSHPLWCESGINLVCDVFCWYWTWQKMFSQLFNMRTCKNLKYIFDEQTWRIYSYHCLNCDCSNVCSAIGWKQMSTGTRPILITTNPGFGRVFGLQLGYGIVQTSLLEAFKKNTKKKLRLNKEVQNLWTDEMMRDDRALTVWTLGQWNLLDSCAISAGKDLHLTLVLVELPIWPTNRIPIVTAIPVARAALKPLLLQTAKHIVALVRLHKTCRNRIFH